MALNPETREAILREIDDGEPEVGMKAVLLNLARNFSPDDSVFFERAAGIARATWRFFGPNPFHPEPPPGYRQD